MKVIVIAIVLLTGCDEGKFIAGNETSSEKKQNSQNSESTESTETPESAEANPEKPVEPTTVTPPKKTNIVENEETFSLAAGSGEKLDLIWIVDNSGSMDDSMNQIRANFLNFIQKLNSIADAKVMSVSKTSGSYDGVPFPILNEPKLTQIDVKVESYDPMLIGAAVSCPATLSNNTKICDQREDQSKLVYSSSNTWLNNSDARLVLGAASSWFRTDARRVYVFVTDDNSILFKATAFQAAMTKAGGFKSYVVYSFRGIQGQSPCADKAGSEYEALERATGGAAFNICTPDWSPVFDRLLQTLTISSPASWTLKKSPSAAKVYLNGELLKDSQYKIDGKQLTLTLKMDRTKENKIQVKYE
jgi:hypothetical protein